MSFVKDSLSKENKKVSFPVIIPQKEDRVENGSNNDKVLRRNELRRQNSVNSRRMSLGDVIRQGSIAQADSLWSSFSGIFYVSIASVLFSYSGIVTKRLNYVSPALLALVRFVETGILGSAMIVHAPIESIFGPKDLRFLLAMRGLTGATSMYLRYYTIQLLPLGNVRTEVKSRSNEFTDTCSFRPLF